MAALSEAQIGAAEQFADATFDQFETAEGIHPETAVVAAARMAGSFLLRSFGFEQGRRLLEILGGVLVHGGVGLDREKLAQGPDPERQPELDFVASQTALEDAFSAVRARKKLSLRESAEAAAAATAFLIQQFAEELDPSTAFAIAVQGFIEGAKTVPGPATS
jgi:hypothetical protein